MPTNELDRIAALDRYGIIDEPTAGVLDGIAQAAADLCQTPTALINLVDHKQQWIKSWAGIVEHDTPRELAFFAHALIEPTELMEVIDASIDERFNNDPLVTSDPNIRFYAGKPLVTKNNSTLGILSVIDYRPRALSDVQKKGLRALAKVVADLLQARQESRIAAIDAIVDHATCHGVLITDPRQTDNPIIYANPAVERMTGYSQLELIGNNCRLLQGADTSVDTIAQLREAIAERQPCTVVLKNYRKDGTMFWNEVTVSAINNSDGDIVSMIGIQHDVTDRLLAQEHLIELDATASQRNKARASRNRLAQIVEDSVSEIYVADASTFEILNINKAARKNLGYSEAESQGLMPWDFVVGMTAENITDMTEPLRTGAIDQSVFNTTHCRKDGSIYPVETRLRYLASQNPPVYVSIVQDISELHRKNEIIQLRERAIEALDVGLSITDVTKSHHPLVYVNQTLCKMTGYTHEELLGQGIGILQKQDSREAEQHKVVKAQAKGESVQVLLKNTRKDGSHFMGELALSPVQNSLGILTHYIGINRDVTAKLDTEARLRQVQNLEAIGKLSGGIAHDFNNLLSVIRGNLELLSKNVTNELDVEHLAEAGNAISMGARLTRRLLSIAKQSPLEPQVIDVNSHVMDVLGLLRSSIVKPVTLTGNLFYGLWRVRIDPSEIENTLINLVINARDSLPNVGEIIVETSNICVVDDYLGLPLGEYIELSVSDNGAGMTEEVKARVFEPFFTTKDQDKGTGLGLASIHGFVQQSGGQIRVSSTLGLGTTISLYLPRSLEEETEKASSTNASDKLTHVEPTTKTAHILVVEDNDMLLNVTAKRLRALGFSTAQASNGPQAMHYLENNSGVDLIFSDIDMDGGMSGYDLAAWAQTKMPNCPVLLTSGYRQNMADKHNDYVALLPVLRKPNSLETLNQAVSASLNLKKTEPS